jgi:GR25 family glycosyltransferase involved in LPS biosynthesis
MTTISTEPMNLQVPIYVVNYKNDERKQRMINRFKDIGMDLIFIPPVTVDDPRLKYLPHKRTSSIMVQHLDCIKHFVKDTSCNYCIVCEDDILISKHFHEKLPKIIQDFEDLELDSLLLGYLLCHPIIEGNWHFPVFKQREDDTELSYRGYPDDIWGSQMYLISRKQGETLLSTFTPDYALDNLDVVPYNPDWTITKHGKRAILYPMMAVEEGNTNTDHSGQNEFHRQCFERNYREGVHI